MGVKIDREKLSGTGCSERHVPELLDQLDAVLEGGFYVTTQDMTLYVDGIFGDDDLGDGSPAKPYATITRAYEDVPYKINHNVEIRIKAGTYTKYPRTLQNVTGREGQFIMEGIDAPVVVAGPFTMTGAVGVGTNNKSGIDLTVAAAGWSVDQFYGKFLRLTSGASSGRILAIHHNTADMISTTSMYTVPIVGDTFDIVEPSVKLDLDHGVTWGWDSLGISKRSSFCLANMAFMDDYSDDEIYTASHRWMKPGRVNFGFVSFYTDNTLRYYETFAQYAGDINKWRLMDVSRMVNANYVGDGAYSVWSTAQYLARPTPPTTSGVGCVSIFGKGTGDYGYVGFDGGCMRGMLVLYGHTFLHNCAISHATIDHQNDAFLDRCRASCGAISASALRVDDGSSALLCDFHVDDTPLDGISVEDGSKVIASNTDGDTANIAGYGVLMGKGCRLLAEGGMALTGTLGAIRFSQSSTTVAYPAAPGMVTDALGSDVIT